MLKEVWKEVTQIFRFLKRTKMGKKWGGVDQCPACLKSVYPLNRVRLKFPLVVGSLDGTVVGVFHGG